MKLICVSAYSEFRPGDEVDLPDGAAYSDLYLAEPGSVAAVRVAADRKAADGAAAAAAAVAAAKATAGTKTLTPPAPDGTKEGA
jgi:hypothetical protein